MASPSSGPIVAIDQDGYIYDGDIVSDVLEYRELRGASLRGTPLSPPTAERLADLEERMTPQGDPGTSGELRMFNRFECRFPAVLHSRLAKRKRIEVTVDDISAGGVKVTPPRDLELPAGEQVVLVIEVVRTGVPSRVMLPSRVAWNRKGAFGLMFAGPPRWERIDDGA